MKTNIKIHLGKIPLKPVVYYYILTILRTYPYSFISLLVLLAAFFSDEKFKNIYNLIMIFLLFFTTDFLMPQTRIKTPWTIRLFGAMIAELVVILFSFIDLINFSFRNMLYVIGIIGILELILLLVFAGESFNILRKKINWSGNSWIALSYRKSIREVLKKDPNILSKYYVLWGKFIFPFPQNKMNNIIFNIAVFWFILYLLAGSLIGFTTFLSDLFLSLNIDNKLSRFVILFFIVLLEIWNSYKEIQYKKLDKENIVKDDPHLTFIASLFRSKMPYFYMTLAFINFATIIIAIFMATGVLYNLIKTGLIGNTFIANYVKLNIDLSIIVNLPYTFNIVFFPVILLSFIVYLASHRIILKNFSQRHNNLKPVDYQKYQEVIIFLSINYLSLIVILIKNFDISSDYLNMLLLPIIIFLILAIINYKFGIKTPLTQYREHVIWLTTLPGLLIIGGIKIDKLIILFFYSTILLTIILKISWFAEDVKQLYSLRKKVFLLSIVLPFLLYFFIGFSIKYIFIISGLFSFFSIIVIFFVTVQTNEKTRKSNTWFNKIFGREGPYTIDQLQELGYKDPRSKNPYYWAMRFLDKINTIFNVSEDAQTCYLKGEDYIFLGNYQEAVRCYDKVIKIDLNDARAWSFKGFSLSKLERYEEAIKCYDKAIEIDPNDANAWYFKSVELIGLKRYEEAIICHDKAISINPNDANEWNFKGLTLSKLERHEEAIRCYNKAIGIDPNYANAWCNKGLALFNLKKYKEAIKCYDKALEMDPNDINSWNNKIDLNEANAWNNKGLAFFKLNEYEDAIRCYDKALEIDSDEVSTWNFKGFALTKLKKFEEAIKCYDKALKIGPGYACNNKKEAISDPERYEKTIKCYYETIEINPKYAYAWSFKGFAFSKLERYDKVNGFNPKASTWYFIGLTLLRYGRYEKAIKFINKAIEIDANDPSAWYFKGDALNGLERYEEAITCYDKAIEINPNDADSWKNKGNALSNLDKYEEAITCYDKAIEIDPNDAYAWIIKGLACIVLEKDEEAITCYDKAIEINPNDADSWKNKGDALSNLQKYEEAIRCYDKAIEISPNDGDSWKNKGNAILNLDKYEEAITCYDKAIEIDPNDAYAWIIKGLACIVLEKDEEAIRCYDKAIEINPNDADPWKNKGEALSNLQKYEEAIRCYDRAIEIDPKDA